MAIFLMHCNEIVAVSESGNLGDWNIVNERMMPPGLRRHIKEIDRKPLIDREAEVQRKAEVLIRENKASSVFALMKKYEAGNRVIEAEIQKQVLEQLDTMVTWLSHRVMPTGRNNYKWICNMLNLGGYMLSRVYKRGRQKGS